MIIILHSSRHMYMGLHTDSDKLATKDRAKSEEPSRISTSKLLTQSAGFSVGSTRTPYGEQV